MKVLKITGIYFSIASPEQVLDWASRVILNTLYIGEIRSPSTIEYKTGYPLEGGLFCIKIFGPLLNWKCICNKHKLVTVKPTLCLICGAEINSIEIRKFRLGCIKLKTPLFHPWYFKYENSIFRLLLDISKEEFFNLIYYKYYDFSNVKHFKNFYKKVEATLTNLKVELLSLKQLGFFNLYVKYYFKNINIIQLLNIEREKLIKKSLMLFNKELIIKKIYILNQFYNNNIKLSWIMLDNIPVAPTKMRSIVKTSDNNFIISKINEVYRSLVLHNNKIKTFKNLKEKIPLEFELIEKLQMQKNLEFLFETELDKNLNISITNILLGKYGRFRFDLLGKRLDYTGRSVIVSGPDLNFAKIGIPLILACSLYRSILKSYLEKNKTLKFIIKDISLNYTILIIRRLFIRLFKYNILFINRAPTLHRMNIQAFQPYLTEGFSIKVYPLACKGFNADFDGDQMSILLSLTKASRLEGKYIISSDKNIKSPASGDLLYKVNQMMVLGILDVIIISVKYKFHDIMFFNNIEELINLYTQKLIELQSLIWFKFYSAYFLCTTIGRIFINNI